MDASEATNFTYPGYPAANVWGESGNIIDSKVVKVHEYMAQSSKGRCLYRDFVNPIHGNCAIYLYPGLHTSIWSTNIFATFLPHPVFLTTPLVEKNRLRLHTNRATTCSSCANPGEMSFLDLNQWEKMEAEHDISWNHYWVLLIL